MWQVFGFVVLVCLGFSEQKPKSYFLQPEYPVHPGKEPYCVDKVEGKKKIGEEWFDYNKCERMTCENTGGRGGIRNDVCEPALQSLRLDGSYCREYKPPMSKPYPECCRRYICTPTKE